MPKAANLLDEKARQRKPCGVHSVHPDASALDAARLMNEHRIGAVAVLDGSGSLVGMFTERDVMTRVVAAGRSPETTPVREVMTDQVVVCRPETPLTEIRGVMREKRIRHLPVVEKGKVVGMISLGDLNTAEVKVMSETISYLEQYMYKP